MITKTIYRPLPATVPSQLYIDVVKGLATNQAAIKSMPDSSIVMNHFIEWYRKPENEILKKELVDFVLSDVAHHARAVIDARIVVTVEALIARLHIKSNTPVLQLLGFGSNYSTPRGKAAIAEAVEQDKAAQS